MEEDYKFIKSVALNDLPEEAWRYITGGGDKGDVKKYMQTIPWLFRGVDIRANALTNIPFMIYKGKEVIDNSEDYQNAVGILPKPTQLFGLIEAALTIFGYAYLFKPRSIYQVLKLRYLLPTSVKADITTDLTIKFKRTVNGVPLVFTPDDIVYFWKPDAFVEIGPPLSSPAMTAANACGVLLNVDKFAKAFFKQGAVKTTLLTTTNIAPQEKDRLKSWWQRVLGMDQAWKTEIINAEAVTPVVIGEGLESLQDSDLTESKRIDIAAALGIPYSVLFSNASNRATAEQDDVHLYDKTIIPDAMFIQGIFNEQVFEPMGYKLAFMPDQMSLYQKDENERAESLNKLIMALDKPEEFLLASKILGFDIDPETLKKIEALVTAKEERREQMVDITPSEPVPMPVSATVDVPEETQPPNMRSIDLEKWETKALNRVKAGRPADCKFESDHIDMLSQASISGALSEAESEADVKTVFADLWIGYP